MPALGLDPSVHVIHKFSIVDIKDVDGRPRAGHDEIGYTPKVTSRGDCQYRCLRTGW